MAERIEYRNGILEKRRKVRSYWQRILVTGRIMKQNWLPERRIVK